MTAYLSGRCANGGQLDGGRRYHIVPSGNAWGVALCGARPGRTSGCGFVPSDHEPTCPRCIGRAATYLPPGPR
jgi:hypothetical protein